MTPRPAPRATPPRDLHALKQAICARARDFEIAPLLDLLATMGYRPGDVYFRGHVTEAPQPTLLHHIEFADLEDPLAGPAPRSGPAVDLGSIVELAAEPPARTDRHTAVTTPAAGAARARDHAEARLPAARPGPPRRHPAGVSSGQGVAGPQPRDRSIALGHRAGGPAQVTVTVNLGLLSCRSPLPSYFQHLLRDASIHEPLVELLQIIDRNLLHARLTCDRPEHIVGQWDEITGDLLRIHGLDSLVGLSWLFRHVFPELPAMVERTSEQLRVPYSSARLGLSDLGSACLGAVTRIDVHDFQVTLRCEDSLLRPGVPWLHEVDRRLRTIVFRALEPVCMNLTVILELDDDRAVATLRDDRGPQRDSYLGQDPLGRPGDAGAPARRVILYHGLLPRDLPDTDELEAALAAQARVTVTAPAPAGRARAAPLGGEDTEDTQIYAAPSGDCELALVLELGGQVHRYQATVRWGVRAWFRDEPYAIELRCDHLAQAAPTAHHHPQLWSLLRNHARRSLSAALATATLAYYDAAAVTDAMVADLIARGEDAALYALLGGGIASDVPRAAWERFVQAQP